MECDLVVPAAGRLSVGHVHDALVPASRGGTALVDLRLVEWVEPVGLVAVASFAEGEARRGRRVLLRSPRRPELARYLSRMRLGRVLDALLIAPGLHVEHDLPPVHEWDTASRLVELRRFTGTAEPDELARMLLERTSSLPEVADALHQCVAELGSNVPEHSGQAWGYVAAQTTFRDTVVQFAVGDAGRGVAAGFAPRLVLTDEQAVQLTLEQGVSRTGLVGHGRGLQKARRLVTALRGHVHMVSGTAHRTTSSGSTSYGSATSAYRGTLLQGSFPLPPTGPPAAAGTGRSARPDATRDVAAAAWSTGGAPTA